MSYKGVFIIDGTGDGDDKKYFDVMKESFCSMLYTKLSGARLTDKSIRLSKNNEKPSSNAIFFVRYSRGPALFGFETESLAQEMLKEIASYLLECQRQKIEPSIYLIGHSRGGAAVIYIAKKVKDTPIKAMFLFDAVDRYISPEHIMIGMPSGLGILTANLLDDTDTISNNVENCYHALRDDKLVEVYQQQIDSYYKSNTHIKDSDSSRISMFRAKTPYGIDSTSKFNCQSRGTSPMGLNCLSTRELNQELDLAKVTSRNKAIVTLARDKIAIAKGFPFGNCGIKGSQNYKEAFFLGTHGAMGGVSTALSSVEAEFEQAPKSLEWRNIEEQAMYDVDVWMSQHLKSEGIFPQYTSTLILDKNIKKFEEKMLMQQKKMCSPKPSINKYRYSE